MKELPEELPEELKNTIRNIEECIYNIAKDDDVIKLKKIDFLEKEGFYENKKNIYH